MSITMLRMEYEQGVHTVVATPHFYARHDTPARFLERRNSAEQRLREALLACESVPEIHVGAEVAFFSGMSESDALQDLCIRGTKYILVEMPMSSWSDTMYDELVHIRERAGLIPIVAHIDRYLSPFHVRKIMDRLEELPVLVQMNAEYLLNKHTTRTALRLIREERVQLLGSDCHNLGSRAPNLGAAAQKLRDRLGEEIPLQMEETGWMVLKKTR